MNDSIRWDPSLVKKFSSSNYYKLINQLRNEVKKYPLNNKKKISANQTKDPTEDIKKISNESYSKNNSPNHISNHYDEPNNTNATVSFNNAKNFSIYNKTKINSKHINVTYDSELTNTSEENSPKTFKERLDKIDLK